jgi:NDP-sugar pyrophosphorylase family protein
VNAMILAAGRGTRLGALGQRIAKVLVDVGGRPLLERHFEYLEREQVSRVVINAHHLATQITSFVADYRGPLEISCIVERQLLGTAGSVRNALRQLGPAPFLVLYGDVVIDEPLRPLVDFHRARRALATLTVHESESPEGKGTVTVDAEGRVTRFEEKNRSATGPALINSGVYVLEEDAVMSLPEGVPLDFGHDVFPNAVAAGLPIYAYGLSHPVIDVGTPEGLAVAKAMFPPAVKQQDNPA